MNFNLEIFQALILGIIQGLTEFLPISSSGHLFVIPEILGWEGVTSTLSFDVALHLGTTVAVLVFFARDFWEMGISFLKNLPKGWHGLWQDEKSRLLILIALGSIPAAVVGLAFEDFFETDARNLPLAALALIFFGILLFLADKFGQKNRKLKEITWLDSFFIGLSQALALIPGVSRSGITITSGLFRNLDRSAATKFSFLLSTPAIVGASLLKSDEIVSATAGGNQLVFLIGTVAAAVSGFLAIKVLLKFVQSNSFTIFVIYRLVLGGAILLWLIGI